MPIEDLKLEFEDENSEKEKSSGVIDIDVELSFNAGAAKKIAPKLPLVKDENLEKTSTQLKKPEASLNNIKNLQIERQIRNQTASHPNLAKQVQASQGPPIMDRFASPDEVQFLKDELEELKAEMGSMKIESEVRARLAEAKMQFLVDYHSDAKMLNFQLTQLLQRMGSKSPALKSELLMSKKLIDEFLKKIETKK